MDIHHIRVFQVAALNKSFTRAADELHLSQSTVSLHVKHLEEELDCSLFHRVGKRVVLSASGELLLEHSHRIVAALRDAEMAVQEMNLIHRGSVRVGAGLTMLVNYLSPVLWDYRKRFPKIDLFVECGSTEFVLNEIERHRLDLGIVMLPFPKKRFRITELKREELVVIVHKNHRLARETEISVREFAGMPFILYETKTAIQTLIDTYCQSLGVELQVIMRGENAEAIKALVRSGIGASVLPIGGTYNRIPKDPLRVLRVKGNPMFRQLAVVTIDANPLPNSIRELERCITEAMGPEVMLPKIRTGGKVQ